jgi:hypothetical protein
MTEPEIPEMRTAAEIEGKPPPRCPDCGKAMPYYGGSAGYIHCGFKILYRSQGWFDEDGLHVKDDRLAGGTRRVDGEIRQM